MSEMSEEIVHASVAQEEPEWLAWLDHVKSCTAECRCHGKDCATAAELRTALRQARVRADRDRSR